MLNVVLDTLVTTSDSFRPNDSITVTNRSNPANNLMITDNYTPRVRRHDSLVEIQTDRQELTVMAARILHLELMLTDKDYRKKFKKQNKAK